MTAKKAPPQRRKRRPLGVPISRLTVEDKPGYVRRWMNDDRNRIALANEAGWSFVDFQDVVLSVAVQKSDGGSHINQIVGTKDSGEPLVAYLMEIKQEWYDEDQAAKQAQLDDTDKAMKEGADVGKDGRYVPKDGIKMSR